MMNGALQVPADRGHDPMAAGVGAAIRAARERAGLSMRALAAQCAVSQPFLSQVENGVASPSLATLYRLAAALDVPPADLLPPLPTGGEVRLVRSGAGQHLAVHDVEGAAVGRLLQADPGRMLEVYHYDVQHGDDLDAWFASESEMFVYLEEGRLEVELEGLGSWHLAAGDALFHPGAVRHRWRVPGGSARILLVVARPVGAPRASTTADGVSTPPKHVT